FRWLIAVIFSICGESIGQRYQAQFSSSSLGENIRLKPTLVLRHTQVVDEPRLMGGGLLFFKGRPVRNTPDKNKRHLAIEASFVTNYGFRDLSHLRTNDRLSNRWVMREQGISRE